MDSNLKVINVLSSKNRREYIESLYDIKFPLLTLMIRGEKTISKDMFKNIVDEAKISRDQEVCIAIDNLFKDLLKPNNVIEFSKSDNSREKGRSKSLNNGHFRPEKDVAA